MLHVDRVDALERHRLACQLGEALVIHPVHFAVLRPQALVVGPRVVAPSPPRQVEQVDVIFRGRSDQQPHEDAAAREWEIVWNRGRMGKVSRAGLCHVYLRGTDEVTDGVLRFPCSFMRISTASAPRRSHSGLGALRQLKRRQNVSAITSRPTGPPPHPRVLRECAAAGSINGVDVCGGRAASGGGGDT